MRRFHQSPTMPRHPFIGSIQRRARRQTIAAIVSVILAVVAFLAILTLAWMHDTHRGLVVTVLDYQFGIVIDMLVTGLAMGLVWIWAESDL